MKTLAGGLVLALTTAGGADLLDPEHFTTLKLFGVLALLALGLHLLFHK
jgi:hypothetical protein